jgi:hypothetical protein
MVCAEIVCPETINGIGSLTTFVVRFLENKAFSEAAKLVLLMLTNL